MIKLKFTSRLDRFSVDIDLDLPGAGVTALFGASGSGKTAILDVIAGFRRGRGLVSMSGEPWMDSGRGIHLPPHKRPVGYLFQQPCLFNNLDVRQNLLYPLRRLRISEGASGMDRVVGAFKIADLLKRRPASLSGGEVRRVALARTLLRQPKLLLLDEPMSGIDAPRKAEILPFLETLSAEFHIPTVIVSHAVDEILNFADEMVVLREGQVTSQGSTNNILESLNLPDLGEDERQSVGVSMRVLGFDPHLKLCELGREGMVLSVPAMRAPPSHKPIRVRIRFRDVALATSRPSDVSIRNILPAVVTRIEQQAESPFCEIHLRVGSTKIASRITQASRMDLELVPGKNVFALVKAVALDL